MTRLWHALNAVAMLLMLMSGLTIFNAHPRLYWGETGTWGDRAWLQIGSSGERGWLFVGDNMFDTTGVLGRWRDDQGTMREHAFPRWITIPADYDLAAGRRWHFLFAWIFALGWLVYVVGNSVNGHFRRDLAPERAALSARALWREVLAHANIRRIRAAWGQPYNPLQRISYLTVIFLLIPLMILTGLSMSPAMNAAMHWLPELFGGRQSARSVHFIVMLALLGFVAVHLAMVALAGPWRLMRGMITGGRMCDGH